MNDDKKFILDPLTCLCKLALLSFMPGGTRLSVSNHVLHIQKYTRYQWVERTVNRDCRSDIANLDRPIHKCIEWFIVRSDNSSEMNQQTHDNLILIANFAVNGLAKMRDQTYETDNSIRIILQYFINNLTNALGGTYNAIDAVPHNVNNILCNKIKICDVDIIKCIAETLQTASCEKPQDDEDNIVANNTATTLRFAHQLLMNRDKMFVEMMQTINTKL